MMIPKSSSKEWAQDLHAIRVWETCPGVELVLPSSAYCTTAHKAPSYWQCLNCDTPSVSGPWRKRRWTISGPRRKTKVMKKCAVYRHHSCLMAYSCPPASLEPNLGLSLELNLGLLQVLPCLGASPPWCSLTRPQNRHRNTTPPVTMTTVCMVAAAPENLVWIPQDPSVMELSGNGS